MDRSRPFINFKAKFLKTDRGFLSENELFEIENKQFSIPRLELVKDLFVFSCYTSLSYIDVFNLTPNNISIGIDGELWINQRREKPQTFTNSYTSKGVRIN